MPTLTDVRNEITRALESAQVPKPLYAVAGVGGLAVEKVRDLHLDQRIAGLGDEARALPGKVQHVQADVQVKVRELPTTVVDAALAASGRATGFYDDLSDRGKKLVDGFGSQRAMTVTDAPANGEVVEATAEPVTGPAATTWTAATSASAKLTSTKPTTSASAKSASAKSTAATSASAKPVSAKSTTTSTSAKSTSTKSTRSTSAKSTGAKSTKKS